MNTCSRKRERVYIILSERERERGRGAERIKNSMTLMARTPLRL